MFHQLLFACLVLGSVLCESKELTQPLAKSVRESPLLKSRKRISPPLQSESSLVGEHPFEPGTNLRTLTGTGLSSMVPLPQHDLSDDKAKITLECDPSSMMISVNLTEPFRGVISVGKSSYPTVQQNQQCSVRGSGSQHYLLRIWHNQNCFTKFDNKRGQFTNTLFVRYHPSLETGGDYSKTLVCKFGLVNFSVN